MDTTRAMERVEQAAWEVANARAMYQRGSENERNVAAREREYAAACEALVAEFAWGMNGVQA
jgi:hypothetical protein